ncbi:DUF6202 family protein [Acinetobacter rudis]
MIQITFFSIVREVKLINPKAALRITYCWREITKTFMFTR